MGIIGWIILGLLAGAIAKILLPGRDPGGLIGPRIGVAGAFVGGWLSSRFLDRPVEATSSTSTPGARPSVAPWCC